MIEFGWFSTHSKFQLPWKINCDDLTDKDWRELAKLIAGKFSFNLVFGVPSGGLKLAKALMPHVAHPLTSMDRTYPKLIVDDVLTTGNSMNEWRDKFCYKYETPVGVVVFARGPCPDWIWPIFSVNEWAQSRGTGLG